MTAPRISMPEGKPDNGTVFFVYRAKVFTGSSMHTAGAITEAQHKAIAMILQGKTAIYEEAVMSEHTIEPWRVAEESFDNDGIHESVIRGLDGRAAIAVTLEFGPNNPGMREANARRIVACVNACAGITTEVLEQMPNGPASLLPMYARLEQQRDKLQAALESLVNEPQDITTPAYQNALAELAATE